MTGGSIAQYGPGAGGIGAPPTTDVACKALKNCVPKTTELSF